MRVCMLYTISNMKDEFTDAMFEEFSISPQDEICLKAHCVWHSLDWDASEKEIKEECKSYGITYKQAMRWKKYWMKFIKKSPEDHDLDRCEDVLKTVNKRYWDERNIVRCEYNVFTSLDISADENKHSALLASFLRETGSGSGSTRCIKLLSLFLSHSPVLSALEIDPWRASVSTEVRIGAKTESEGGRIDILISTKDRAIIIENKIYAQDQEKQLVRYHNYAKRYYPKGFVILYLTLDGHQPSAYSCGDLINGKDFYCVSYRNYVLGWLQECAKSVPETNPYLLFTIKQYISVIKKLTMREEFIDILCDKDHATDLSLLLDNRVQLEKRLVEKYLLDKLYTYFSSQETNWEVELMPQFYNNVKIAFRPKYWKQLGIWHVVQIVSGNCYYGLCVDGQEVKRGFYPQAPLRTLQSGSNDAFPFGWLNIPFSMERVVNGTTYNEIAKNAWQVMSELADDQRIDFGYFNREAIVTLIGQCAWIKSADGSHEYTCKDGCGLSESDFVFFVKAQRFMGVELTWEKDNRDYVYLFLNGYKYWTKGDLIEDTIIINRAKA